MRYFLLAFVLFWVVVVSILGFRGSMSRKPPLEIFPDMDRQPKPRPQAYSDFFADGRTSRLPVPGTVARAEPWQIGEAQFSELEDIAFSTGIVAGTTNFVETIPVPVTEQLMARGHERYQIYCAPCHGSAGDGKGITARFGMAVIANLHDARIVSQPDGEIFQTITHGRNLMGAYGGQIPVPDRWAITAYLRALQRSRLANIEDVPADMRAKLPGAPHTGTPASTTQPAGGPTQ